MFLRRLLIFAAGSHRMRFTRGPPAGYPYEAGFARENRCRGDKIPAAVKYL